MDNNVKFEEDFIDLDDLLVNSKKDCYIVFVGNFLFSVIVVSIFVYFVLLFFVVV